jgi:DNA-binding transcriptional ArsR family regulator
VSVSIWFDKIKVSDEVEALVLVKLRGDYSGYTVPQLVRFLKKFYRGKSEQAIIKRVPRALDRLRDRGLVITQKIGTYRFARLTELGLKAISGALDLVILLCIYRIQKAESTYFTYN